MRTQKTTEPKQNGEMEPTLVGVTVSPEECTLNGNKQMLITFYEGTQFPSGSTIVAVFRGSEGTHSVCAKQLNSLTYTVLIPAHHKPEQVTLSLIIDSREKSRVIYRSHFLYTAAPEHYIAELLVQSVSGTPQLDALLSFVPPLKTKADHNAFDNKLTETFSAIALPRDWTLIGYRNLKRVETGSTLLHFSARLGLAKFTRHLLSLPGAKEAVNMDNKWGMSPVDIASENSNDDTTRLLNDFAASVAVDNCTTQHPLLFDGLIEQQQHQEEGCYGDVPMTTGVGCSHSGPTITGDSRQDKRQQQESPTLARIKPKFRGAAAAAVSNNKDLLTNLTSTFSNSCPTLVSAVEQQAMNGENSAIEFKCPSTSSTNSDELPCTSSEDSPEPKHHRDNNHKSPPMEKKNGVMMTNVPKTVSPHLTSQLSDSGVPLQSRNCANSPDTREDSVTPVQVNQYSDQDSTLKRQSSTPVANAVKSASAESSPSMKRVTSISLYVKSPKSRPPSQHQATLQVMESDDIMETQSAPNLFSAIGDHDSLTTIIDHDDDDRNADSTTPTATTTVNDIMYNDNSSHPECTDSSSDSEVSSINDIHVLMKNGDLKEQHNQQQILRRHSQQGTSVKHSMSDYCLLERAISPTDPARKRHSDILGESPNESVLYSTGSEPVVSKPHSSDLNWSSNDEYLDFGDSNDTLDELSENDGRDSMIEYQQHGSRSVGRPHSAEISHMVLEAKIRQMHMRAHALSSSTSKHSAIRKVHSSSEIDSINTMKSVAAFRSHNKLHPKLVEEMYSVPEGDPKLSYSYPGDAVSFGSGDKINFFSKIGILKTKKSHPVSRNNSDVTGLKKQASHVSVKRSASAVSDSAYIPSDRLLSRDSKDYPSSQDSSTLSLRGSGSGGAPMPPSPLISSNITPVELNPPSKRRSGTLSPSIPRLPAEDEEPVENVMSQPSIAGIMQSRKPMVHCDPEIESSLDRPLAETPPAMQKTQKKGDNKTNLKRAQTMVAAESEGSQSRKFWNFRTKHKQKKKYAATVKVTNKPSTYPRPSSASSNYSPGGVNTPEESSTSNQSTEPETSNVFPVKQMSHRQSGNRIEVKNTHFSPTVSPTERPVTATAAAAAGGDNTGASQPKAAISTSSSNLHASKLDLTEPPRKTRSSSELYESEKEAPGNTNDTSVEEDESLARTQEDESVAKTFSAYPELYPDHNDNAVWSDNVPPKVLSKLSKSERDRQAVIYELVQTENHILVAIQILLIVFKKSFHEELKLPEEIIEQMFPHLEPLLALTEEFYRKLKQRQDEAHNHVVDRIGDILVEHFTGDKGEEVAKVYGAFCSRQLRALDIYREQNRVKRFQKLATSFANTQVCQRRNYPEFITLLAQRITKYTHLVARLSKKTDPKHRDAKDLELASTHTVKVTSQVNQIVDDQSRHEKLLDIQMNLEVHPPRWEKNEATRKELKSLNLMANGRNMIKKGTAKWVGSQHSQELPVLIVLVTDMVVILVERDQKYSLACLQDRKPPVIRLYDLIVRVNEASAKSAVCELFLMEGGTRPEFYTIQLTNARELMEWKQAIQTQIEYCKQNNLKCEYFGSGRIASLTTDDKKDHRVTNHPHEKVRHESVKKREKKKGIGKREKYLSLCGEALELAKNMLSYSPSLQDLAQLQQVTRGGTSVVTIPTAAKNPSYVDKSSPKTRSRANTIVHFKPPSTTDDIATKPTKQNRVKGKGTKVERSQTFLGKEEKKERPHTAHSTYSSHHRSSSSASGGGIRTDDLPDGALFGAYQQPPRDQMQLRCIVKLVEALEGMQELVEEQDSAIESLQDQLSAIKSQLDQSARMLDSDTAPLEEMTSQTENDLLTMIDNQLSEQQALSGMSLEDLRHLSSNTHHSGTRQQNGSVTTGRPQSISELPSNDMLPSWSSSLTEQDAISYSRTMSSTDTS